MKFLMATDGSVHASGAMLTASRLLQLKGNDVDVVCVAGTPLPAAAQAEARIHDAYKESVMSPARRTLEEARKILAHVGLKINGRVETGPVAERILELAPRYDLIILGAYGNHDRKQPGLGPVSSRLLQLGSGNLMIGRELVNEGQFRVLAALDSSEASLNALSALWSLFNPETFDVTLLHVTELPWANALSSPAADSAVDSAELGDYRMQLERELRSTASTVVNNARELLERRSISCATLIKEGDPALEISSEAESGGYDLVILGASGVSDVKHALLGSVSLKVAWDAPCSVAVIRGITHATTRA